MMTVSFKIYQDIAVLVEERRQKVLELVSRQGFVSLTDLAETIRVSESTIRRDLEHLHQQGVVKRTHGGAIFAGDGSSMPALEDRSASQLREKVMIARKAVERIQDGDAILLDGGTTTLEVARLLVGRRLQIVTNSLPIANLFANSHETDLVILGGYIYPRTGVAMGPLTIQMLEDIHVHQTILSVGGITPKGLFNSNLLLVETERQMMRCADEVVVVADHTKLGRQALAFLCDLKEVDTVIIDPHVTPDQRQLLDQTDARVIWADSADNGKS